MPKYRIEMDGRTFELEGDHPPTEAEARAAIGSHLSTQAPAAPAAQAPKREGYLESGGMFGEGYAADAAIGAAKGLAHTVASLGELVHRVPGVSDAIDAFYGVPGTSRAAFAAAHEATKPESTSQKIGYGAEQIGEFFVPGATAEGIATKVAAKAAPAFTNAPRLVQAAARVVPQMAAQGATSAAVAGAQGGDPAAAGVVGAVVPAASGVASGVLNYVGGLAEPMVRAAIKPTVTAMKRVAGAASEGLDAKANQLVGFIIENKVTTAAKAREIFAGAERELQRVLSVKNAPTDAPQRSMRYLQALEKSASKQGLPAQDVATIRNSMAEVLESGMGEDVVKMVPQAHPTLVDAQGKPITVLVPETSRALRDSVPASEALERARANSQWDTRKAWGEQKGAQLEASKAVERAQRDAVKAAVPESAALLRTEGHAIQAENVLDRMAFRQANRDGLGLPGHIMAAGGHPVLAFASNWLRSNQLKAGMWADALRRGLQRGDVQTVATAMERLGIAVPAAATGGS